MKTNHYGHIIDSESPITGVVSCNNVKMEWMWDEFCPSCEEFYKELSEMKSCPECGGELEDGCCTNECGWNIDYASEGYCQDHDKLLGDWKKDKDGLYEPDETGEYAAILTSSTFNCIQVVWSKYTERHGLTSPCFPGQADIDSKGEYLCYVLPKDLMEEE